MTSKLKSILNKKHLILGIAGVMVLTMGYISFGYISKANYASQAAGPVETGYGCYNYGNSAVYGSCRIKLVNTDISNLSTAFTTSGIVCTPSPAEINTKVSCTGTLNEKRLAPVDVLSLGVEGQALSACTFAGDTFTCPNIAVGSSTGTLKIFGSLGNNTASDTAAVNLTIVNHTLVAADLVSNNLLAATGPFSSITCGNNNVTTANLTTTCVAAIRAGFIIPADFKFGIGTNPGGTCVTTGTTLTCTNVPTTSAEGPQDLKAQIGSSTVYQAGKVINVTKTAVPNTPSTPTTSTTTPTTNNTSTNPVTTATNLIRTGGVGLWLVGAIVLGAAGWVSTTFIKSKKKAKPISQDK